MSRDTGMRGFSIRSWVAPHSYASPRNYSGPGGAVEWTRGGSGVPPNLGKNLGIITHLENV